MKKIFHRRHRRSIRLPEYDYSQSGCYYITICTNHRELVFGNIKNAEMELSELGEIVKKYLLEIPQHFENVFLDEYIIMPNHIHFNINIVGVQNFEPLQHKYQNIIPKSVGSIIRAYKASVTHWCRKNGYPNFKWQKNYFEHIIRNEEDHFRITEYIKNNPLQWELDEENPYHAKKIK